jgi:esterase/lipase superfamily enzyme|tara:strand:+ start:597 stop:1070 length:474 start_codon:yes stop_codon:yes gene_type:complete
METTARKIKPNVNIVSVQPLEVSKYWLLAEFMVSEALKYSGGYADSKHIYDQLLTDQMQLFIMFGNDETEHNKVFGIAVTRVGAMPNFNQLEIIICTGQRRDIWEDKFVSTITNFARQNDCKRLCIWARPGWERVSKKWGWKKQHVQLVKELDELCK